MTSSAPDTPRLTNTMNAPLKSIETMQAWQCIGCGKIDGPQNCVGVCKDRKVELVYAADYEALRKELASAQEVIALLAAQMRQIVHTEPHPQQWERSYRALQARARNAVEAAARYTARQLPQTS